MYELADRLHKTIYEIEAMTLTEYNGWMAYFYIMKEKDNGNK
jgi:hypothetical protein